MTRTLPGVFARRSIACPKTPGAYVTAVGVVATKGNLTPNCQSEIAAVAVARPVRPGESSPGLHPSESPGEWWLDVVGKGRKLRRIAVSPQAIEALLAYGATLGMPPELQDWPRGVPVL